MDAQEQSSEQTRRDEASPTSAFGEAKSDNAEPDRAKAAEAKSGADKHSSTAVVPSLLDTRISDLGLKIEGSAVEKFVQQLYRELEQKKIFKFRPTCYLTDE